MGFELVAVFGAAGAGFVTVPSAFVVVVVDFALGAFLEEAAVFFVAAAGLAAAGAAFAVAPAAFVADFAVAASVLAGAGGTLLLENTKRHRSMLSICVPGGGSCSTTHPAP
jgi:predicted dienelactone hydrolase